MPRDECRSGDGAKDGAYPGRLCLAVHAGHGSALSRLQLGALRRVGPHRTRSCGPSQLPRRTTLALLDRLLSKPAHFPHHKSAIDAFAPDQGVPRAILQMRPDMRSKLHRVESRCAIVSTVLRCISRCSASRIASSDSVERSPNISHAGTYHGTDTLSQSCLN